MEINKFIGELPADYSKPSEKELNEFRSYISRFTWRNAKTYEQFSPHEYILNFPCWKMKEDGMCKGNVNLVNRTEKSLKNGLCLFASMESVVKC